MEEATRIYYEKRGAVLVKNLQRRHCDAYYCATKEEALKKALELIPEGSSVGWGGCHSAHQIGLPEALNAGNYVTLGRDKYPTFAQKEELAHQCFNADFFITGANALSLDGHMVNIDGNGNRVAAIIYGPEHVIVVAGMNKVCETLDEAIRRARTVAAPMVEQMFQRDTPCNVTGACGNCLSDNCVCNQIVITRNSRVPGRIKYILVGEPLGF